MPSGTNTTKCSGFTAGEICSIIGACRGIPVRKIQVSGLTIEFQGDPAKISEQSKPLAGPPEKPTDVSPEPMDHGDLAKIQEEIDEQNTLILDPVGYERDILDDSVFDPDAGQVDAEVEARRPRASI